ncbi:MAG: hypothetical protein ACK4NU_03975 [Brevundimonas sp.]
MDPAYASTFAALFGSIIGGSTSFLTTWLTQRAQRRDHFTEADSLRRQALYGEFIKEASRLYADALNHEKDDVTDLVTLNAAINQMRILSSTAVIDAAEEALEKIIAAYLAPNIPLHALPPRVQACGMNPLQAFADACRAEMSALNANLALNR